MPAGGSGAAPCTRVGINLAASIDRSMLPERAQIVIQGPAPHHPARGARARTAGKGVATSLLFAARQVDVVGRTPSMHVAAIG